MSETIFTIKGCVTKDVDIQRIKDIISFEIQSMVWQKKTENTKEIIVDVIIKEE